MFGIGLPELLVVAVVALLVLGPAKLPELARSLGKGLAEFRRASADLRSTIMDATQDAREPLEEMKRELRDATRVPPAAAPGRRAPPGAAPGPGAGTPVAAGTPEPASPDAPAGGATDDTPAPRDEKPEGG